MRFTVVGFFIVVATASADLNPALFLSPPDDAKPMTWMHIMNQNLSREGLERDFQRLADAGVGGALLFSVEVGMPKGAVVFNSPEFRSILQHGVNAAADLGLKIGVHNCDGWTSSGGPWVPVEDSMKRVVFSETMVKGGDLELALARPRVMHDFYRDIGVVALPATADEMDAWENRPRLSASCQQDLALLTDGKEETVFPVTKGDGEDARWIQFSYETPFTARSIYLEHNTRDVTADLYASPDGETFRQVSRLHAIRIGKYVWAFQNNVEDIQARHFRIQFNRDAELVHVDLSPDRRMPNWKGQISIFCAADSSLHRAMMRQKRPQIPKLHEVVDLSASVSGDGHLKTRLPEGRWRIYRFGYTSTGACNAPATDGGRGFECDKLKASALDNHFAAYVGKLAEENAQYAGNVFRFAEIDSYEMGGQNWTDDYAETFKNAYGYDLMKFMPLYAGREIESLETSSAVLRDLRTFTCDLMTENYFKRFTELCHQHGMVSYIENYGFGPINGLGVGGHADIPMGEFWVDERPATHYVSPVSAAHTYGKPVISAEAFTSSTVPNWGVHPYMLKEKGDHAWTKGINEFMFHRFAHQANTHVVPGMSMNKFGSHIDGTQTWWLNAGTAWMKYIQRGSWLLRQGVPVNDLLIYVGEGSPHKPSRRSSLKNLPSSNNYDFCDTDVLMNRIRVQDGKLVLPEGTTYQAVYFQYSDEMSFRLLERIGDLSAQGATLLVSKPKKPIGYIEQQSRSSEFGQLADGIWATHGSRLIQPPGWDEAFAAAGIEPDYVVKGDPTASFIHRRDGNADFYFIHNPTDQEVTIEASFRVGDRVPELWHPDTGTIDVQAQFIQQAGRTALSIHFDPRGSVFVVFRQPACEVDPIVCMEPAGAAAVINVRAQRTELRTECSGSFNMTFASGKKQTVTVPSLPPPVRLLGRWQVVFDGLGLKQPAVLDFEELSDWKDHPREAIRHFSGTAIYRKRFDVPASGFAGARRWYLDLGQVDIAAEVTLNGRGLGTLWKPPFRVDVTGVVRPGENELEVYVTNPWVNRLVGDEQVQATDGYHVGLDDMPEWYVNNQPLPEGRRSTFSAYPFYGDAKTHVLVPSGLQGPVLLVPEAIVPITL